MAVYPGAVRTAADFTVGEQAIVRADQGIRIGVVTKIGRTRVSIRHPRNKKGDMVERPYSLDDIVIGQVPAFQGGWCIVWATGQGGGFGSPFHSGVPVIEEPAAPYRDEER